MDTWIILTHNVMRLTLRVDSGDRWLTSSSWGPPVETERKEGLSLCVNITFTSPYLCPPPRDH